MRNTADLTNGKPVCLIAVNLMCECNLSDAFYDIHRKGEVFFCSVPDSTREIIKNLLAHIHKKPLGGEAKLNIKMKEF
jgi:hypothetical protein